MEIHNVGLSQGWALAAATTLGLLWDGLGKQLTSCSVLDSQADVQLVRCI